MDNSNKNQQQVVDGTGSSRKNQSEFFSRLYTIPLVHAVLIFASETYTKAKESVWFVGRASDWLENSWKLAMSYATPFINHITPFAATPLARVDNFASKGLETLERTVPAIKKQPQEIVSDTQKMISSRVTPAVERLNTASETLFSSKPAQLSCDVVERILTGSTLLVNSVLSSSSSSEKPNQNGFPHEQAPEVKSERVGWLFKESYFLFKTTTQRLFGMVHSKVDSASNAADAVVRKSL
jgi:hypothetical protein